jgi:hypothetical protein
MVYSCGQLFQILPVLPSSGYRKGHYSSLYIIPSVNNSVMPRQRGIRGTSQASTNNLAVPAPPAFYVCFLDNVVESLGLNWLELSLASSSTQEQFHAWICIQRADSILITPCNRPGLQQYLKTDCKVRHIAILTPVLVVGSQKSHSDFEQLCVHEAKVSWLIFSYKGEALEYRCEIGLLIPQIASLNNRYVTACYLPYYWICWAPNLSE